MRLFLYGIFARTILGNLFFLVKRPDNRRSNSTGTCCSTSQLCLLFVTRPYFSSFKPSFVFALLLLLFVFELMCGLFQIQDFDDLSFPVISTLIPRRMDARSLARRVVPDLNNLVSYFCFFVFVSLLIVCLRLVFFLNFQRLLNDDSKLYSSASEITVDKTFLTKCSDHSLKFER